MNKARIHRVQSALIAQCLKEGINHPSDIYVTVVEALKTINESAVAGHKAAKTKRQRSAHQS